MELAIVLATITLIFVFAWPALQQRRTQLLAEDLRTAGDANDRGAIIHYLKLGAPPDAWSGETPHFCLMCKAVRENDVEMVRQIFQSTAYNRDTFPRHCQPLLLMAVNLPSLEIAEILLDAGAPVAQRMRCSGILPPFKIDQSPLGAALERNDEPMVKLLLARATNDELQHPTPPEEPIGNDSMLLHSAVSGGNPTLLKLLLERGIPRDGVNSAGETALHIAAQQADREAIEVLLAYGANPAIEDLMHELPGDEVPEPDYAKLSALLGVRRQQASSD